MAWNYDQTCPLCGKRFHVEERPMGVAGGKDKEDIDCPWCGQTVDQKEIWGSDDPLLEM